MGRPMIRFLLLLIAALGISVQALCSNLGRHRAIAVYPMSVFAPLVHHSLDAMLVSTTDVLRVEIIGVRVAQLNVRLGESRYTNPSYMIHTIYRFKILEIFRSDADTNIGDIREVAQLGGFYGNEIWIHPTLQPFRVGDNLILFLTPRSIDGMPAALNGYRNAAYRFPRPVRRMTDALDDNQVLESFNASNNLTLTAGDLRRIAEMPIILEASQNDLKIGTMEEEIWLSITANRRWNVSSDVDWITASGGVSTIRLIIETNVDAAERIGRVTMNVGGVEETITIKQAGWPVDWPRLTIYPSTAYVTVGGRIQLEAIIENLNGISDEVRWSTFGNISPDTHIDERGVLFVGSREMMFTVRVHLAYNPAIWDSVTILTRHAS